MESYKNNENKELKGLHKNRAQWWSETVKWWNAEVLEVLFFLVSPTRISLAFHTMKGDNS